MQYYIDKKDLDSFIYNGTSSTSFNFIIEECNNRDGFENDFEFIEVPGRSGDLIINKNRKKNKIINIKCYADIEGLDADVVSKQIKTWLCGEVKYKALSFSNESSRYQAIVVGPVRIDEEIKDLLTVEFKFSCKEVI